jgi:GTPase
MTFTIAVVGRPNVGKSTLFNRLVGKRLAIVDNTPGVTRDRREGQGRLSDLRFTVIDTAGLEDADDDTLEGRMRGQTERALEEADVALLLIDARAGLTPLDHHFAKWLRGKPTPVLLLANKCEGAAAQAGLWEAFNLGLGEPVAISAEHGEGLADLYASLAPFAESRPVKKETVEPDEEDLAEDDLDDEELEEHRTLQMAVVGRPNVGKSTLINHLLGEDRMLTGPEAGVTRDSVSISWTFKGRDIRLVDTAGMRRKSRVTKKLEGLSVGDALRAIRFAHVVVLTLDSQDLLEKQDLTIARMVIEEGRSLILAVNKWDLVQNHGEALRALRDRLETSMTQARGIPVVTCSALTGRGMNKLLPAVLAAYDVWNKRVSTGQLNRWLEGVNDRHPPPMAAGRRIRLRYITQAKARPPTFVLFASRPEGLPESYLRYLTNSLREDFNLPGIPIRLLMRKGKNPYAK